MQHVAPMQALQLRPLPPLQQHRLAPVSRRAPLSFSARQRCRHVVVAAATPIETDAAARVAGTPAAVADYLSRVDETWPEWYPRLVSARRTDGTGGGSNKSGRQPPPPVGTSFNVVVRAGGGGGGLLPALDLPVTVKLLERSSKRVAFAATSPLHEAREQYVLMPCPGDARGGHTTIRHVSEVRLRGAWAGALAAPVVGGIMRAAPREALARLESALRLEEQRRQGEQQQRGRRRSTSSPSGANGAAAADGDNGKGGFWKGLFGGGSGGSASSPPTPSNDDPHGLYAALGLEPRALIVSTGGDGEQLVKAAYRAKAKQLHPDANVGAPAAEAERFGAEFARVQLAYAVLRDASARRRYDRGEWRPEDGAPGANEDEGA